MATSASITQNVDPVVPHVAQISWAVLTAANTAKDGTGTTQTIFTSAADGSVIDAIICKPHGTNVASVLRIFINNGLTSATPDNNILYKDVSLPATTLTEIEASYEGSITIGMKLPNGYKINVCLATAVAAGWAFTSIGGDY